MVTPVVACLEMEGLLFVKLLCLGALPGLTALGCSELPAEEGLPGCCC